MDYPKNLGGKTAVVTGAGRGIGLCIAACWVQAGGNVVLVESEAAFEAAALRRVGGGDRAVFTAGDVACESDAAAAIALAVARFGRLDAVVHNAAIADNRPIEQLSYADWKRVLDVNLSGGFLFAKYAAAHLRKTNGAIALIASTRALMSEPHTEAYSASKAGIVGLAHALAASLAPVRVNCISPGWIVTDDWRHDGQKTPLTGQDNAQHPVGRVGRPEDIAAMALYLCSENAGFITGQNFVIDGGMTRKMIYS